VLDQELRRAQAREIKRILRPGGLVLWWDFSFDNPRNPNVKGIRRRELIDLWKPLQPLLLQRTTLAPPIAHGLRKLPVGVAASLEAVLPPVRTHLFAALRNA
jgi:hypothetical protein